MRMRIKMRMRVMMMMIIIIIIIIICSGKPKIPRPLLYRRLKVRYHKISSGSDRPTYRPTFGRRRENEFRPRFG